MFELVVSLQQYKVQLFYWNISSNDMFINYLGINLSIINHKGYYFFFFCRSSGSLLQNISAILKQIEKKTTTQEFADAICKLNLEYQNFQKLFTDVIYCTEDTYHVFIDLAATTVAGGSIIFTTMATYGKCWFQKPWIFWVTYSNQFLSVLC